MSVPGRLGVLLFSYAAVLVLAADLGWVWLDGPLGLLMVGVLPGWAVVTLLDPLGRLGRLERVALTAGVSFSIVIVVGLGTGFTGVTISRASWLLTLGGLVVVASTVALLAAMAVTLERDRAEGPGVPIPDAHRLIWPLLAGVLAIAFAADAVVLSAQEANPASDGEIVQLWALPSAEDDGRVDVGVANLEADTSRYRLTVTQGEEVLSDKVIVVPEGTTKIVSVRPTDGSGRDDPVEAVIRSVVIDIEPLRRVYVDPPAGEQRGSQGATESDTP